MDTKVELKELKIRPREVAEELLKEAEPASGEVVDGFNNLRKSQFKLKKIKTKVRLLKEEFDEKMRQLEVSEGSLVLEKQIRDEIDALAFELSQCNPKVMSIGLHYLALVEESILKPCVISDKIKIEYICEKFSDVKEYLKKLDASKKHLDQVEERTHLFLWEKRQYLQPALTPAEELRLSLVKK